MRIIDNKWHGERGKKTLNVTCDRSGRHMNRICQYLSGWQTWKMHSYYTEPVLSVAHLTSRTQKLNLDIIICSAWILLYARPGYYCMLGLDSTSHSLCMCSLH
jgi:hypothetical protein